MDNQTGRNVVGGSVVLAVALAAGLLSSVPAALGGAALVGWLAPVAVGAAVYGLLRFGRRKGKGASPDGGDRRAQTARVGGELPLALIEFDVTGRLTYGNEAFERMFGYGPADLDAGLDVKALVHYAQRAVVAERVSRVLGDGQPAGAQEYRMVSKDGREFVAVANSSPVYAEGRVAAIRTSLTEIPGRRMTDSEMRELLDRQEALLENVPACVFLKDTEGRYTAVNRAFRELLPVSATEPIGKTDRQLFSPSVAHRYEKEDAEVMGDGKAHRFERAARLQDGTVVQMAMCLAPVRSDSGTISGMVGIGYDVTDRKRTEEQAREAREQAERVSRELAERAEQLEDARRATLNMVDDLERRQRALREANAFQQKLLSTAVGAMFTVSGDHRITSVNEAFCRLTGYAEEEILGQACSVLGAEDVCQRGCALDGEREEGRCSGLECTVRRADGRLMSIIKSADVIRDEDGNITGAIESFIDVTELVQAKQAAEEASRAKSEFLANMSHEIRTPMNGIIGMTGLVLDTELSGEQRDALNAVQDSADSLLTVINDILDFSKIEAGKLDLEEIPFSLRQTVEATVGALRVRAQAKELELTGRISPDLPEMIVGDPGRLRQVLVNLLGNAVKFTESGRVELVVEAQREEPGGAETIRFSVRDTGIGIPPEKLSRIFEAFEQADGSTTRQFGGTGLGLSISAQLVAMMGGTICVESYVGQGSTFWFTVPFELASPDEPHQVDSDCLEGMEVLIVDDNETNCQALRKMVERWGMCPRTALNGELGLELLREAADRGTPPPLVLLDTRMPGVDGFELARRIRKSPRLDHVTIVMLTSGGRRGDAARCQELGIAAYLTKPVSKGDLLEAIRESLSVDAEAEQGARRVITRHSIKERRRCLDVLLAEDNPVNQKVAAHLLGKWGHRVTIASNGQEAVDTWREKAFDVVLMDVQMPRKSGMEATAEIRRIEESRGTHTPIIAMTAHAMKGDRERCLEAGMDDYVSKPIQPKDLQDAIARSAGKETSAPNGAEGQEERGMSEIANTEVFDPQTALERTNGSEELLGEIVEIFLETCPEMLAAVRSAVASGDCEALARAAHSLKGAAASIAAGRVQQLALQLELAGKDGQADRAVSLCEKLEDEVATLRDVLSARSSGVSECES
jgi:PAS domain S-box-containing protein